LDKREALLRHLRRCGCVERREGKELARKDLPKVIDFLAARQE
jgi:hypothetical protein